MSHAATNSGCSGSCQQPIRNIIWRTPQELADQRLQHEIDEMVAGRLPSHRLTRSSRSDARRTPSHFSL